MTYWIEYCNHSILIESSFTFVRSNTQILKDESADAVKGHGFGRKLMSASVRLCYGQAHWHLEIKQWQCRWTRRPNVQTALSRPCLVGQTDTGQKLDTADSHRRAFFGNSRKNETRTQTRDTYGEVCADF